MDVNDLRTLVTVVAFLAFLGIVAWAYSAAARRGFEQAAQLPFDEDTEHRR